MDARAEILGQFESLGDNCEFGLVQRIGGIEPLGLLRFAGFHIPVEYRLNRLLDALERGFSGLGDPDTVQVTLEGRVGHEEYIVRESAYELMYHTFQSDKDVDADAIRRQQSAHLRFLRRKLLDDLANAAKIFVWKTNLPQSPGDTLRLFDALRRFGNNRLLWVTQNADAHTRGLIEPLAPGLVRGYVDRFAPYDDAPNVSFEAWVSVCSHALNHFECERRAPVETDRRSWNAAISPTYPTVRREALADILAVNSGEIYDGAGIGEVRIVAEPGRYYRRPPDKIYADTLLPNGAIYHERVCAITQDYPALHRVQLASPIVTGQGAVITRDDRLLEDSCWEFFLHGHMPFGLRQDGIGALTRVASPSKQIDRPSLLVKRPWWRNFGHWVVDGAALLAMRPFIELPSDCQIIIGAFEDPKMREVVYDMLGVLCPGVDIIEQPDDEMWSFSDLYYFPPVHQPPLFKLPVGLERLRSAFLPDPQRESGSRRLYISRGTHPRRPLENEQAAISICQIFCFEVVQPELLTIEQQISLFNSADIIVGVEGAALTNIVFCKPSAAVVVLSPNDWADPFFWDIAGQLSLRYFELFGPISTDVMGQAQNPFSIDVDDLIDALDQVTSGRETGVAVADPIALAAQPHTPSPLGPSKAPSRESSLPPHKGAFYQSCLGEVHRTLRPRSYLEIGAQVHPSWDIQTYLEPSWGFGSGKLESCALAPIESSAAARSVI